VTEGTTAQTSSPILTARFSVDASAIERPTRVQILARTVGGRPRIAGAHVTVVPAGSLLPGICADDSSPNIGGLLLLIAMMGALGGIIHGISSFQTFVGNREFVTSWVWWYVFKPFLAGLVALVVFLVFRAGFGAGDFSLGAADCLKVAAFAGLIGLFAEPATLKLKDIFDTLFTPRRDPRRDSAGNIRDEGPKLESLEPASVTVSQTPVPSLTLKGTGFSSDCQVKIGDTLRKPTSPSSTTLVVQLLEGDISKVQTLPVTVYNKPPDGDPSNSLELKVIEKGGTGGGGAAGNGGTGGGSAGDVRG
jgi:IPT/TIG domain